MRVLFLLSCLEPAGSETYCLSLEEAWKGRHDVFWISDQLHNDQTYTSMPIHAKAFPFGVINRWRVAAFIRKHRIEVIHSHSRRAHWVAAHAAKKTKIPHITTIHQPLPVHYFSQKYPCLGDQTIAIDEAVADHLRKHFGHPKEKIHLIRNGVDMTRVPPLVRQSPKMKQVLLIGRLSGGRWNAFEFFLKTLERTAKTLPPAHYKIAGRVPYEHRDELMQKLAMANVKIAPSTIESWGYIKDLSTTVRNSDAAIAAGRSALECMAQGRPVVFLGEGGVIGMRKPETWATALRTNFGDHLHPKEFNSEVLEKALREILDPKADIQSLNNWARQQMEKDFEIHKVASQVLTVYGQALRS